MIDFSAPTVRIAQTPQGKTAKTIRKHSRNTLPSFLSHSLLSYSLVHFPISSSAEDALIGDLYWVIFGTFGDLTSWFWTTLDGLFGSIRQNCSKTGEITTKTVRKRSGTSTSPLSSPILYCAPLYSSVLFSTRLYSTILYSIPYGGCTVFFLNSTIGE